MVYVHPMTDATSKKIFRLNKQTMGWRSLKHPNGQPMFNPETGTMLDERGNRSIFDDVDE